VVLRVRAAAQAARVYAAFHALPRDANGRVAAMQLHGGVGALLDGIVSGGLNETVGLLGISHLGDLSEHSRMTWTEFVAFLHAAHSEQGNEARLKEGMDALLTEEEQRLKKHHQRMAAQGLADGEGEDDDLSDDGVSIARDDIFLQRYGYSWDYVLVFRTTTERDMLARSDFQQEHSEGKVARRLAGAGLEVMMYKSSDQDEIFLLVRASLERLMQEADRIDMKLRLDKEQLREVCNDPQKHFSKFLSAAPGTGAGGMPKAAAAAKANAKKRVLEDAGRAKAAMASGKISDADAKATMAKREEAAVHEAALMAKRFKYSLVQPIVLTTAKVHDRSSARRRAHRHAAPANKHTAQHDMVFDPYDYIYGKCEYGEDALQQLYARHHLMDSSSVSSTTPEDCIFRSADRVKLLRSIMGANRRCKGAGIDLMKMMATRCTLGVFPLHQPVEKERLRRKWMTWSRSPNRQPLEEICAYFGEKIALYFAWLGHYTIWLVGAAVLGCSTHIYAWRAEGGKSDNDVVPYFSLLMMLWSTFYLESWKRKNATVAMKWGMAGFETEEQMRPQFENNPKCEKMASLVTGKPEVVFNPTTKLRRQVVSCFFLFIIIMIALAVVVTLFIFAWYTTHDDATGKRFEYKGVNRGPNIAAAANAGQILLLNEVVIVIAVVLNNYENHRTDTQYEDNLIAKVFSFQFVNSFSSLFYIAFLKGKGLFKDDQCNYNKNGVTDNNCMGELNSQLMIIFVSRLAIGNFMEVVAPWGKGVLRGLRERMGSRRVANSLVGWAPSAAERQFVLEQYDRLGRGLFQDYAEIIVQFGYVTLFVAAFPLAPLLALANNIIEIRVDAFKLICVHRRPDPLGAEDIGTWHSILEVMAATSVVTNGLIVCFTASSLVSYFGLESHRLVLFVLIVSPPPRAADGSTARAASAFFANPTRHSAPLTATRQEHVMLVIKLMSAQVIEDEPESVAIQLQRQDYIVRRIMMQELDENDASLSDAAMFGSSSASDSMLVVHSNELEAVIEHNSVQQDMAEEKVAAEEEERLLGEVGIGGHYGD